MGFSGGSVSKESACNAGDLGSIPGLGRSPEEGNGNPLQYSCLENHMDRGVWWAAVQGTAHIRARLSTSHILRFMSCLYILSHHHISHSIGCLFVLSMFLFAVKEILGLIMSYLFISALFPLP